MTLTLSRLAPAVEEETATAISDAKVIWHAENKLIPRRESIKYGRQNIQAFPKLYLKNVTRWDRLLTNFTTLVGYAN